MGKDDGKSPLAEVFVGGNVGGDHVVYGQSSLEESQLVPRLVSYEIQPHKGDTCK